EKTEVVQSRGDGYTVNETDHVKLVKALNEASLKYDTASMRGYYSGVNDTIHNNLENMTLDQNLQMMGQMQKDGITATIASYPAIWETINDKPNAKGQTNFVIAYMILNLSRGTKTTSVVFNQICAIKDGKVVEEWDVYDTKPFTDLTK
ncbi:MAG: hypothetical protein ACKO6K_04505, partial [Chitinophagaceae bacterium]